ncbi:DUF6934 family protein [Filimonas effusa]|uniref:Uncharacterized protein n=1 Tax=Filimonas effusa TaxID=2508721 RepID=A0A4Q1D8S3_9BACT|nr:hypothetical protein [Filimonas effusa]RXK85742.1 hypothetical protein ESB13_02705 [Filimonas effusa]
MELDKYEFTEERRYLSYGFWSDGPKGRIAKVVQFIRLRHLNTEAYNLVLGDKNEEEDQIDSFINTNNNDRDKVLATVANIAAAFMKRRPNAAIFFAGNTTARNRLYRMGISRILREIELSYTLKGFRNGQWEPFQANTEYIAYLLECKY